MRNVLVRLFNSDGRPVQGAKVVCWVYQFAASGWKPEQYTDSNGETEFDLDIDAGGEIAISVNGVEKVSRSKPKGSYRLEV